MSDEKSPVDVAYDKIMKATGWDQVSEPFRKADIRDALNELYDAAQADERAAVENRLDAAYQRVRRQIEITE